MTGVFFTKKQKILLRKRRLKKLKADGEQPVAKRRKLDQPDSENDKVVPVHEPSNNAETTSSHQKPRTIIIPANLDAKAARKFRKEARRKAHREDGIDDPTLLKFVPEGQEESIRPIHAESPPFPTKDRSTIKNTKKKFPSIQDLLKLQKLQKAKLDHEAALKKADDALPSSYKARYVALDCEMVGIGTDGKKSALARVSIVDWNGAVLLDTFVQVPTRVTDFRTHVSGVTPKDIQRRGSKSKSSGTEDTATVAGGGAMDVKLCRERVAAILKDKVLVGHALHNDLSALMLLHPKKDIRDTATYRPFQRLAGSKWRPRKLRDLVKQHLGKDIQVAGESHDSVEDAACTMELFKQVREVWEKDLQIKQKKFNKKR